MSAIVKHWFDSLDEILTREAKLAGLLSHGTLTGSSREFFVKRVLRSILPKSVHVGSGRVVNSQTGAQSKQIDVVLYDGRFPFLELDEGIGLYFIEGVIGTIEVKSTLNTEELHASLDNCHSVTRLPIVVSDVRQVGPLAVEAARHRQLTGTSLDAFVMQFLTPSAYVFAFNSALSSNSVADGVSAWAKLHPEVDSPFPLHLPRVIATDNAVGLLNDSLVALRPSDEHMANAKTRLGDDASAMMSFWKTKVRFGFLASHVMGRVAQRLGTEVTTAKISFSIEDYLPVRLYARDWFDGKPVRTIFWSSAPAAGDAAGAPSKLGPKPKPKPAAKLPPAKPRRRKSP